MDATAIDHLLLELNPFGRVQVLFLVSSAYVQFFLPMTEQSINFLGATPDHHCSLKEGFLLNESIPIVEDENGDRTYSQCQQYSSPGVINSTIIDCQNGWEFDDDVYGETIITEWELACDQNAVAEISQSLLQVGGLIGAFLFGIIADRYGRRPSFLFAGLLYVLFGISICLSPNFVTFVVLRFFCGFSQMAVWVCFSSNISEYMIPKYRNRAMTVPAILFSLGLNFMALLAFLIQDWRYFQLAIISPVGLGLCGMWFLPESLRWLISEGKLEKANVLIKKLAKQNGTDVPSTIVFNKANEKQNGSISTITQIVEDRNYSLKEEEKVDISSLDTRRGRTCTFSSDEVTTGSVNVSEMTGKDCSFQGDGTIKKTEAVNESEARKEPASYTYFDLLKPPVLHVTIIMSILRLSYTLVYFGFALSTGRQAGNPYLNFFYSSLVEVPARLLAPFVYRWIRRTYILSICFYACAACLILTIFVPTETKNGADLSGFRNALSLMGKFFVVLTLGGLMLLVMELYPTPMRNMGNGLTLCIGRIGGIIAPFVLYLDEIIPNFSSIIMTSLCIVTATGILTLPDTRKTTQPQNVDDLRLIMKSHKRQKKDQQGHNNKAFEPENT